MTVIPSHLQGAADALCAIARQRHPDQAWVAGVEDVELVDAHCVTTILDRQPVVATGADHLDAVADVHGLAAAGGSDDDRGDKAA